MEPFAFDHSIYFKGCEETVNEDLRRHLLVIIKRLPYLIAGLNKCLCDVCVLHLPNLPMEGTDIGSLCDPFCLKCLPTVKQQEGFIKSIKDTVKVVHYYSLSRFEQQLFKVKQLADSLLE